MVVEGAGGLLGGSGLVVEDVVASDYCLSRGGGVKSHIHRLSGQIVVKTKKITGIDMICCDIDKILISSKFIHPPP